MAVYIVWLLYMYIHVRTLHSADNWEHQVRFEFCAMSIFKVSVFFSLKYVSVYVGSNRGQNMGQSQHCPLQLLS